MTETPLNAIEPVVPALDPWTLAIAAGAVTGRTAGTWQEAATRLSLSGLTPVAVRTTTRALASVKVETAAVSLVPDSTVADHTEGGVDR